MQHHEKLAKFILSLESNWTLLYLDMDNNGDGYIICHNENTMEYVAFIVRDYIPETGIAKHAYDKAKATIEAYKRSEFERVLNL